MQRLLKTTVYIFLAIFAATAILTILGIAVLWFGSRQTSDFPYLRWLIGASLTEVVGVVIMIGKRGVRFLPEIRTNESAVETAEFMKNFIMDGSSVTIVSNRLAWLMNAEEVKREIVERAKTGTRFEIITSQPVVPLVREPLEAVGVLFFVTGPNDVPEARFTLINADRSGAERLAIAKGTHPNHEITIFDSDSGPQIIGLAKDIVRKSKVLANVAAVGRDR
ncbi:MAG TPA: hypothetical protein VMB18_07905 [Terriglobales bacterium]|nr:hypothetical protein [Terriglobales bacterium]